ncbi:MAG: NAD-dependent epimerase/dehydratase family protein [Spirochaetes bacterium]|nr:NAD-dependent epimerase/dehydratase family protein [Spirochaetota bacterium]
MKKKKVIIFGSTGMAGHVLTRYLLSINKYDIINIAYRKKLNKETIIMDIQDIRAVRKIILKTKPDIIVNFIGILIKSSEERPDKAIYINSYFPHFLERMGKEYNIKIIHLSTDCVFSGKIGDYREMDKKDGEGWYARSKALGEILNEKDLTFRTSIVGPELKEEGEGLFHWFMNQKGVIWGHSQVYWTGVTTLELAKAIDAAIEQDLKGLYHLIPEKKISKYELLQLFKKIWNKNDVEIKEFRKIGEDKSLMNTRSDFKYKVKDYEPMLLELHEWMYKDKDFYTLYRLNTTVLVTGYKGFLGKNVIQALKKRDDVDIQVFGREDKRETLRKYLRECDFIIHLAGVNRPKRPNEFEQVNAGLTKTIVDYLLKIKRPVPIFFTSSIQADLKNPYGQSKKKAEKYLIGYSKENHAKIYIYRFPNVFGRWCKPNYNSVVATFCYNISHNLDIKIHDSDKDLDLIYIDDVVNIILKILDERFMDKNKYYYKVTTTYKITLQQLADTIYKVNRMRKKDKKPIFARKMTKYLYETLMSYVNDKNNNK